MAIKTHPDSCIGCPLHDNNLSTGFMEVEGTGANKVMIIGEALGEKEAQESLPFRPTAQAGSVLERAIKKIGATREQFSIANIVWCRPPGNKLEGEWYEQEAVEHCNQYLSAAIDRFKPKVIVALGNVPLKWLTGLAGKNQTISSLRGFVLNSTQFNIPVIPSYHPAFIARGNEKLIAVLMHDLNKAKQVASGKLLKGKDFIFDPMNSEFALGYNSCKTSTMLEIDIKEMLDLLRSNPDRLVAYDIETFYSQHKTNESEFEIGEGDNQIRQIQFSTAIGTGIALPWEGDFIDVAREIMALPNPKAAHNGWRFDNVVLRNGGIEIAGVNWDTMTMWHHLQPDLPADLQFVASLYGMPFPWKHLSGVDLGFYGIADVDAVMRIMDTLPDDLRKRGVWDGYVDKVLRLQPILEGMQDRGVCIDVKGREKFKVELKIAAEKAYSELQKKIPAQILPIHPPSGFKTWPEDARKFRTEFLKSKSKKNIKELDEEEWKYLRVGVSEATSLQWKAFPDGEIRPFETLPFLPRSVPHLKILIKHYKEKVPLNLNDDESTAANELEKLAVKTKKVELAEILNLVLEYRPLTKMVSTYIDGWQLDENNLVHTTFTFRPASGQLSSIRPNIQNGPAHGSLAESFKRIQIAKPGTTIIAADYGGCHLKTMAFEAEDMSYYRMACIDGHSFIAAHLLKLPERDKLFEMKDEELRDYFKWLKSDPGRKWVRDKKAKPSLLGTQLGLGANKLFEMNRGSFKDKKEAQAVLDLILKQLYPKIGQWQKQIKDKAHRQGFLLSNYGFIRWFWNVYRWHAPTQEYRSGDDAEKALAFLVQNDAFGKKRESMLDLAEEGLAEKYGMFNDRHDEGYFYCPNEFLDEAIPKIKQVMESPAKMLKNKLFPEGLTISVEIKVGKNLAELKEVKL